MSLNSQIAVDIAKLSPSAAVATTGLLGVSWSDVAYMLTALYTALMIVHYVWKHWIRPFTRWAKPAATGKPE